MKLDNLDNQFREVVLLIQSFRNNALRLINTSLIDLYWNLGEYISRRISTEEWGKSIVQKLADYIEENAPGLAGYSDKNLGG